MIIYERILKTVKTVLRQNWSVRQFSSKLALEMCVFFHLHFSCPFKVKLGETRVPKEDNFQITCVTMLSLWTARNEKASFWLIWWCPPYVSPSWRIIFKRDSLSKLPDKLLGPVTPCVYCLKRITNKHYCPQGNKCSYSICCLCATIYGL